MTKYFKSGGKMYATDWFASDIREVKVKKNNKKFTLFWLFK
jgi:hypothetical protein